MSTSSYLVSLFGRLAGKKTNDIRAGNSSLNETLRDPTFTEFMLNLVLIFSIMFFLIFVYDVWKNRSLKSFDASESMLLAFWITVVVAILELFAFVALAILNAS